MARRFLTSNARNALGTARQDWPVRAEQAALRSLTPALGEKSIMCRIFMRRVARYPTNAHRSDSSRLPLRRACLSASGRVVNGIAAPGLRTRLRAKVYNELGT